MPNDSSVVFLDGLGQLPENQPYYSEYFFIAICTEGKAQVVYDGRTMVIHKDEVFIAVPGSVLSDYLLSPSFDCKVLIINSTEVITSQELHSQFLKSSLSIKKNPIAKMTETDKEMLFNYYNLIIQRKQKPGQPFYRSIIHYLVSAFLMETAALLIHAEAEEPVYSVHGEQIVERFVQLVNENKGRVRRVENYADQLNISSKYLSTLVRNVLHRKPTDIIRLVTIKEMERLLHYSDKSIKQIANMMEFPNTSFFGKYFKSHTGMTPASYRKKHHH